MKQVLRENNLVTKDTIGLPLTKAVQIKNYLIENKIESYIVIDDEPVESDNLIQTNGDIGLTEEDCAKAVLLLSQDNC